MGIESLASATVQALPLGVPQPPHSPHVSLVKILSLERYSAVVSFGPRVLLCNSVTVTLNLAERDR